MSFRAKVARPQSARRVSFVVRPRTGAPGQEQSSVRADGARQHALTQDAESLAKLGLKYPKSLLKQNIQVLPEIDLRRRRQNLATAGDDDSTSLRLWSERHLLT